MASCATEYESATEAELGAKSASAWYPSGMAARDMYIRGAAPPPKLELQISKEKHYNFQKIAHCECKFEAYDSGASLTYAFCSSAIELIFE